MVKLPRSPERLAVAGGGSDGRPGRGANSVLNPTISHSRNGPNNGTRDGECASDASRTDDEASSGNDIDQFRDSSNYDGPLLSAPPVPNPANGPNGVSYGSGGSGVPPQSVQNSLDSSSRQANPISSTVQSHPVGNITNWQPPQVPQPSLAVPQQSGIQLLYHVPNHDPGEGQIAYWNRLYRLTIGAQETFNQCSLPRDAAQETDYLDRLSLRRQRAIRNQLIRRRKPSDVLYYDYLGQRQNNLRNDRRPRSDSQEQRSEDLDIVLELERGRIRRRLTRAAGS